MIQADAAGGNGGAPQAAAAAAPSTQIPLIVAALQAELGRHGASLLNVLYAELIAPQNIPETCRLALRQGLAALAALLPRDHIRCLELANDLNLSGAERILLLRAALLGITGDTIWLHYDIVFQLFQLIEYGVAEARAPCMAHAMLVLQLAPPGESPIPFMRKILARLTLPHAPREALLYASQALRGGQADAMPIFRAAAMQLGLVPPGAARELPISVMREAERACGLADASSLQLVSTAFLGLAPAPVVPAAAVTLPPPKGDRFYHMFRDAGKTLQLPGVGVYAIEGGTVSYDLTQLGRTQFYVFDRNGACIENLSYGAEPFVDASVEAVAGELCLTADNFAGAMNVCHFLLDHLTRVAIYDRLSGNQPKILFAETHEAYQRIIGRAGLAARAVYPKARRFSFKAERLLVASNIIADFRHPAHLASPWALRYVRDVLGAEPAVNARPTRRLFISRQDARARHILNWDAVAPVLEKFGFETINLSELTLEAQIGTFTSARFVAGVHGAGLTNAVFSPPGLGMLEILPPLVASRAYWILCHGAGHDYTAMVADDPELPRPDYASWGHHPEYNDRNVRVDPARLEVMLGEMVK